MGFEGGGGGDLDEAALAAGKGAHGGDGHLDLGEEDAEDDGAGVHDDHAEELLRRVRRRDVPEPHRREDRVHKVSRQDVLLRQPCPTCFLLVNPRAAVPKGEGGQGLAVLG
eukprot:1163903-Rhodomonas_salina.2